MEWEFRAARAVLCQLFVPRCGGIGPRRVSHHRPCVLPPPRYAEHNHRQPSPSWMRTKFSADTRTRSSFSPCHSSPHSNSHAKRSPYREWDHRRRWLDQQTNIHHSRRGHLSQRLLHTSYSCRCRISILVRNFSYTRERLLVRTPKTGQFDLAERKSQT